MDRCPLLAGPLQDLPDRLGRHPPGARVRLRHGPSGDRLVVLEAGAAARTRLAVPDGVAWAALTAAGKVGDGEGPPFVTERVAGVDFHVGAASFFQVHRAGAEAGRVVAVESWRPAARDARRNLRGHPDARLLATDVGRALQRLPTADLVVLDPPRSGAGAVVATMVAARRPRVVALVSCDPAALARDVRAFSDAGYPPAWVQPVDLFPQTAHVEAVTALYPAGGTPGATARR